MPSRLTHLESVSDPHVPLPRLAFDIRSRFIDLQHVRNAEAVAALLVHHWHDGTLSIQNPPMSDNSVLAGEFAREYERRQERRPTGQLRHSPDSEPATTYVEDVVTSHLLTQHRRDHSRVRNMLILKPFGRLLDRKGSYGDCKNEWLRFDRRYVSQLDVVQLKEGQSREPCRALIAIRKCLRSGDSVQESRCLRPDVGIGFVLPKARHRPENCRLEAADISNTSTRSTMAEVQLDDGVNVQVDGHRAKRSSNSAQRTASLSAMRSASSLSANVESSPRSGRVPAGVMLMPSTPGILRRSSPRSTGSMFPSIPMAALST